MQGDEHGILPGGGAGEQQQKTHGAPDAKDNEDDGDERQLPVRHGRQGVGWGAAGQDGPILGEGCVLQHTNNR